MEKMSLNEKLHTLAKIIIITELCVFALILSLFSIKDNKFVSSVFSTQYKEENEEEIEEDHWEISTVLYDSTVDDGNTPLTSIDWDASDGGYGTGTSRTITVQINYKNTNVVNDYEIGELILSIPNLMFSTVSGTNSINMYALNVNIVASANDDNHSNYDWTFVYYSTPYSTSVYRHPAWVYETLQFKNAVRIEARTNVEGSLQIRYEITPAKDEGNSSIIDQNLYQDSCTHSLDKTLSASLNDTIVSNEIHFSYTRTYIHPWTKQPGTISLSTSKITSLDGLPNANDYIWVKYSVAIRQYPTYNSYPRLKPVRVRAINISSPDTIILDSNLNEMDSNVLYDAQYGNNGNSYYLDSNIIVGYPKTTYFASTESRNVTNSVKLYATYYDSEEELLDDEKTANIDLTNFEYILPDKLYILSDYYSNNADTIELRNAYYESLIGEDLNVGNKGIFEYTDNLKTTYKGVNTTYKTVNDGLLISDGNNSYRKIQDNEYYISKITFNNGFKNGNNIMIPDEKYDCELWIRKKGKEFEKVEDFKNQKKIWNYTEQDEVVAYYTIIKDMSEGLNSTSITKADYVIQKINNIPENGNLIHLSYLQVYEGNTLVPLQADYNYNSIYQFLGTYDSNNSLTNALRTYYSLNYKKFEIQHPNYNISTAVFSGSITQDAMNERFILSYYDLRTQFYQNAAYTYYENHHDEYTQIDGISKFIVYDLLPKGFVLTSSEDSIKKQMVASKQGNYSGIYYINQKTVQQLYDYIDVQIVNNWHNTGRTKLTITYDVDEPFLFFASSIYQPYYFSFNLHGYFTYDAYLEYGNRFVNYMYVYTDQNDPAIKNNESRLIADSGVYDSDALDINENGLITDKLLVGSSTVTINAVISTNQDVQVTVQSNQSNYDTGRVDSPLDSNYNYKLRVRTGSNDVTNLVIYDSLERYAMNPSMELVNASGTRNGWKGEFLGVDTSYAEGKGYTVKTYYSESDQPGSLSEDDSWHEFTDDIDKSIVKSLAFEYLDSEGNPAVLPANSLTYVLINMKSPNQNLKTFAYNGCWTEWNAIDSATGETVDFITGINSNIVRVGLPNSVEPEDISITVDKYWNDNHDELGVRPDSFTVMIIPNGVYSNSIDFTMTSSDVDPNNSDHWFSSYSVPKYDADGELITYTVTEDTVENGDYVYAMSVSGNTITNILNKKVTITKVWVDNHNAYLTRPGNVKVYVSRTGMGGSQEVTITGNYSTDTWSNYIALPVYDTNNDPITYSYQEDAVTDYTSTFDSATVTFTNTLSKNMDIQLTKEWVDNNNEYETRPSSITINLLQNNTQFREVILTGNSNIWTSSNQSVPMYDNNGVKYTYTISEGYITSYNVVEYDQTHYKVTNTLKENMDLIITKNWIDNHNEYETRPDSLVIKVKRNGSEFQTVTLSGDSDTWTSTITVPKYDSDQVLYQYTLEEENDDIVLEYSDVSYEDYSITNRLSRNEDLTITKIWNDYDNQYLTRPENVNIKFYQNDVELETLELNSENEWQIVKEDMPVYDENGVKYSYTILEEDINSRYGNITYDQTTLTVTNELTDIPSVTLYFTVKNGYMSDGELKFDQEGYLNTISGYNLSGEEYTYHFELVNVDTGKIYNGSLSTTGILQFDDLPYGTYRAVEKEDDYFDFVSMLSIEDIPGVTFTEDGRGGIITISPTGNNILFGANIINKIEKIINPETLPNIIIIILLFMFTIGMLVYINYQFYQKQRAS